jgi:cobalt-zinc-cadmium efflux system protein
MLVSSWRLLRESTAIFMETSGDIDPEEVGRALAAEHDVVGVHDLHVWTVTSGFPSVSAHVLVGHGADCHATRARLEQLLAQRFGLVHSTLQVEHAPPGVLQHGELPVIPR